MHSPSPFQLLPRHVVRLVVSHVAGSSRLVFTGLTPDSCSYRTLLKPLLWVCHNFRDATLPLYCRSFKFEIVDIQDKTHETLDLTNPCGVCNPSCRYLGYPTHDMTRDLEIVLDEIDVYLGKALEFLSRAFQDGCAFPIVHTITFLFAGNMIRRRNITSSQEAEANISAFVRMIKQIAPRVGEIRVRRSRSGCGPGINPQFGNFISQLYQLVSRVEYDLTYFSRSPVVLPLARIRDLVHIRYTVGEYGSQAIELARQNAMTLQSFVLAYQHHLADISRIIRDASGSYVTYPCLRKLKLCGSPGYKPRPVSDGVVPFPSLRHLCLFGHNPFDDDTLFRGNAATLETLDMLLDSKTVGMLRSHKVFTPVSHPRLQFVNTNFCGDLPEDQYDSTVDCLQFALSVGLKAAVRHFYGRFGDTNLLAALPLFSDNPYIQVLMLPISQLKLCDVITLIKSLPLLAELTTGPPYLGPIPINITVKELPAYVVSKHYPMGKRFRCWHFRKSTREPITYVVKCVLLLALACPSFTFAVADRNDREEFMEQMEIDIASDTFKPYASRLGSLLFSG
ncbi:hypothetical protein GGI19_000516 [Coemansia pectinata]|uniref:Uncharacterized protein n=1 Tax=Coemansia pectinata TaxID=1052879 RepID=A0A9W8LD29_9FUNG|nr:hypothetical protein GGI19_000516 [Coemansia pectinata]